MLLHFLRRQNVSVPPEGPPNPWKHQSPPPQDDKVPTGFRALYVYGDPRNAVLSVFRRGYQNWHIQNMQEDLRGWNDDWTLRDYLAEGKDLFGLAGHFDSWVTADRDYPIMIAEFDALWDEQSAVFSFFGLPTDAMQDFPERKERNSDWRDESSEVQDQITSIYGDLINRMYSFPGLVII